MIFPLACGWLVCLLIAFAGYGRLILACCRLRCRAFSLCAAVGIGFLCALGGLANLVKGITTPVIVVLVCVGIACAFFPRPAWRLTIPSVGSIFLIAALAVPVMGNLATDVRSFNLYDDLPAYLTLPVETAQLHTLPADPFNERRVTSCLGAPYFLQSLLLAGRNVHEFRAFDVSLGFILYAGLVLAALKQIGLKKKARLLLAALVLVLPVFRINTTFVVLPAALFSALFLLMAEADEAGWRAAMPLSLVTAALCALKSNYVPAAVLNCALFYCLRAIRDKNVKHLLSGVLCGMCVLAWLVPWMIDLHAKEGTFLFPLLGRGFDASSYGTVPLPNGSRHGITSSGRWVWITAASFAGPYVIALIALVIARRKQIRVHVVPVGALLIATVVSVIALASSTGGESIGRYSLPFQIPVLVLFCGLLWRWKTDGAGNTLWWRATAVIILGYSVLLAGLFGFKHYQYRAYLEDARVLTPPADSWFDPAVEEHRIKQLQSAMPAGEPMLARLFVTYPFDFARNRIYVADYTGMAGLPPGMPVGQPPDTVRAYLLSHGIHFIAYDYRRCRLPDDDPATTVQAVLADPSRYGRHGWLYMQVKITNAEQDVLAQLGQRYRRVYDDGTAFVAKLDDASPIGSDPVSAVPRSVLAKPSTAAFAR